ncbi:MAG: hypothetical protein C5B54_08590, partial [Acidobacteria bacterium]
EMVSGTLPFQGKSTGETLEAIFTKEPIPPVRLNPNVPPKLEEIIAKALEKDRNLRYHSAADMRTDLQRLKRDTTHPSVPPAAARTTEVTNARQSSKLWIGLSAIVVVLLASAILFFKRQHPEATHIPVSAVSLGKTAIAVLPFANMSADKDQEYFSDGLTEELTDVLAKNPKLRVTSRTSAFSFKGKEVDIKTIAQKLNVTHVLEGSVRKAGNQLRITAQLIEAASDSQLWSQTYDRQLQNIFAVQDEIADSVAGSLKATLDVGRAPQVQQTNPAAYNAYLEARYLSDRRTKEEVQKAVDYYEQALQIDPNYARAWVGLSKVHSLQSAFSYLPVEEGFSKARKEVDKALELDPNLAEAYAQRGWIKRSFDWDWVGADTDCKRALQLDSTNVDVLWAAAYSASTLGRNDEAIQLDRRAIELDPLKAPLFFALGHFAFYSGKWDMAEGAFLKALELNPQYISARVQLIHVYVVQSKPEKALAESLKEQTPGYHEQALTLAYFAAGKKEEADAVLAEYIPKFQNEAAFQIAEIYAFRGEADKSFEWLERAYKQRDGGLDLIKDDPLFRNLEHDPRYAAFMKKMGLPL